MPKLTDNQYEVLRFLGEQGEALFFHTRRRWVETIPRIPDSLHHYAVVTSTTRLLDSVVQRGWVERVERPQELGCPRRLYRLTDAGRETLAAETAREE